MSKCTSWNQNLLSSSRDDWWNKIKRNDNEHIRQVLNIDCFKLEIKREIENGSRVPNGICWPTKYLFSLKTRSESERE